MGEVNRHGLDRTIPCEVARQVRQRCGFGCVCCGDAVIQYDHITPPYADALRHDPAGIVLLCGGCHDRKTRGQLSVATILRAAANPKCKQTGFSWGAFDLGSTDSPVVWLGDVMLWQCDTLLSVNGEPILAIHEPEAPGGPFRLTANFLDRDGNPVLSIVDNEWQTLSANWDVQVEGRRITVRRARGDIVLILRTMPPEALSIERMSMQHCGVGIECREGQPTRFLMPDGREYSAGGCQVVGAKIGVELSPDGVSFGCGGGWVQMGSFGYLPPVNDPAFNSTRFVRSKLKRTGRNDSCPCGSRLQFKRCHGLLS